MAADKVRVKIECSMAKILGIWKMQIKDYLYQKNLYQPLLGEKPESMKKENGIFLTDKISELSD